MVGREVEVLFEKAGRGCRARWSAKSDTCMRSMSSGPQALRGQIARVRITASERNSLGGALVP